VTTSETRSLTGSGLCGSSHERSDGGDRAFDQQVGFVVGERERRSDHDQVAVRAVGTPGAGVQEEPVGLGRCDDLLRGPIPARERLLRGTVADELQADHRAEAADIADVRQVGQRGAELLEQPLPELAAPLDQLVLPKLREDRPPDRGADRVVGVREPMDEAEFRDGVVDLAAGHAQSERPVAGGGPLPGGEDVRPHAPVVAAEPPPGAPEPGHHLVGDEQHAVAPADLGDRGPVVVRRNGAAQRGAGDRFRDERGHGLGPGLDDRAVERLGVGCPAPLGMRRHRAPVLVRGRNV
jgi:hypothetical protein